MNLTEFKKSLSEALTDLYSKEEINSLYFTLVEHYTELTKVDALTQPNYVLSSQKQKMLKKCITELADSKPIQYILGETVFFGNRFFVNEDVLIPRQETEELIAWILENTPENQPFSLIDIGTGSGCIAISIAKERPKAHISALDISEKALAIAKQNALINHANICWIHQNILTTNQLPEKYDFIVSNPPYVRHSEKKEIHPNVLLHEPHLALFVSDENPLLFYEKIATLAQKHLNENGKLFFEINQYLSKETQELLEQIGFENTQLRKDLNGNYRMACSSNSIK